MLVCGSSGGCRRQKYISRARKQCDHRSRPSRLIVEREGGFSVEPGSEEETDGAVESERHMDVHEDELVEAGVGHGSEGLGLDRGGVIAESSSWGEAGSQPKRRCPTPSVVRRRMARATGET